MSTPRPQDSAAVNARVAFEARNGLKTVKALAGPYGVHPTQLAHGTHRLQQERPDSVSARRAKRAHAHAAFQAQFYHQSGPLEVEWDWLKKTVGLATGGDTGVE